MTRSRGRLLGMKAAPRHPWGSSSLLPCRDTLKCPTIRWWLSPCPNLLAVDLGHRRPPVWDTNFSSKLFWLRVFCYGSWYELGHPHTLLTISANMIINNNNKRPIIQLLSLMGTPSRSGLVFSPFSPYGDLPHNSLKTRVLGEWSLDHVSSITPAIPCSALRSLWLTSMCSALLSSLARIREGSGVCTLLTDTP